MKKIYQSPSIELMEIEASEMICQSANSQGVAGNSGSNESPNGGEDLVKSNSYHNPVQWEDWQ